MIVSVNQPRVIHLSNKILVPGANQVDAKEFAEELKNPVVKKMVEDMVISFDEKDLDGKSQDEKHLSKLQPKQAVDLIENTVEIELLEKWQNEDDRKQVQKAIEKQIEALKSEAKRRSDNSEENLEADAE